jgi:hypothetical protein
MKLGLTIKITNGGESETYSINKQETWARYASDARSAIKELQGFDGSDKTVYLLKFLGNQGYLLSVIKSRPEGSGRPNDNTAAWIFVPIAAIVSATEMERVLKQVEEAISENKGIDKSKLNETFYKNYDAKNVLVSAVGTIVSSVDGNYALRYYNGDYRLNELLGEHIAQIGYAKYKGIFIVDKNSGIRLSSNQVLNFEPKQFITVSPLKSIGGFVPGFPSPNGFARFEKEIELAAGSKITMEWRKDNYAPIVKTFTAGVDRTASLEIKDFERKIRIQRSFFKVEDFRGKPIPTASVRINNQSMTGFYLDVPESMATNGIFIDVKAIGYEDFHESLSIPVTKKTIRLRHRKYYHEYTIPIYDKDKFVCDAKLSFDAEKRFVDSPIKGYERKGNDELIYGLNVMSKIKTYLLGFASCVIVILLWAGVQELEKYEFRCGWPPFSARHDSTDENSSTEEDVVANANDSLMQKANNYLDGSKSWNKDSLESNEITQGLFDELNEFKVDEIKRRIEEKSLSSQKLQKVFEALQENRDNGNDPHIGKESNGGKYNSMSDKTIDIDNYIKWLSVQHKESTFEDKPVINTDTKETSKVPTSSRITGKSPTKATDNNKSDSKKTDNSKKRDLE